VSFARLEVDQMTDLPQHSSRFDTPSSQLNLEAVASRQTRKIRIISLAIAIALHGSLAIWKVSAERRAVKPLTTRFIKREPRLIKPLELRKAPKPKRRQMRRRMKRVRAKVDTRGLSRAPKASQVLDSLVRPATTISQTASFERPRLEPMIESSRVEIARTGGARLDVNLEMVDLKTLDYGQYQAAVVQDPEDKRKISGYFKLARVYAEGGMYKITSTREGYNGWFHRTQNAKELSNLAEAINEYTDIDVEIVPDVAMSSNLLLECPWAAVLPRGPFVLTKAEARNLGEYLTIGGFAITAGRYSNDRQQFNNYFMQRGMFQDAFAAKDLREGRHWNFVALEDDHPLFHSFYDMAGYPRMHGTPGASSTDRGARGLNTEAMRSSEKAEGVEYAGRLVGLLEVAVWTWKRHAGVYGTPPDRGQLEYGINMVVFALTQEGSLAARYVRAGG
jgi:hypothetical protein